MPDDNRWYEPWKQHEDDFLRELAEIGVNKAVIARRLGRTVQGVEYRALRLRISFINAGMFRRWVEADENTLRDLAATGASKEFIAHKINRTVKSVVNRARKLRVALRGVASFVTRHGYVGWNDERIEQARIWWLDKKSA